MNVDELYKKLGNPGRYHVIIYILVCFSCWSPVNWNHLAMSFYGAVPKHHCKVPSGFSLNESIPAKNSCYAFENFTRYSGKEISCPLGWEFERYKGYPVEETIVTEFNLVCDQLYLKNLATTIYFIGVMTGGIIFGHLADKWGRKPSLLTALFVQIVIGGCLYFVHNYALFVVFRFVLGILMQGLQTCSFVFVAEFFIPAHRSITGTVTEVFWALSGMLLALFAYLLRDWHYIQLAISLPSILFVFFIWVLPESPRWLVAKQKYDVAKAFFKTAANFNKVSIEDSDLESTSQNTTSNASRTFTLIDLVRTAHLRKRSLILFFIWFCISLGYYGLTFSISSLSGDKYLNFFIAFAIEMPGYVLATILITKVGRNKPLIAYLALGGILCIITPFIPTQTDDGKDITGLKTALALIGRTSAASCFSVMFLYTSELFPTVIRNLGVGACAFWTRVGGVVAPQILLLGSVSYPWVPIVIFGSTLLIGAGLAILLPETLGRQLTDTIDEEERTANLLKSKEDPGINHKPDSEVPEDENTAM